jgi:hypothetical protein
MALIILLKGVRGGKKAVEIIHSAHISIHSPISECVKEKQMYAPCIYMT